MKSLSHVRLFATPWTVAYQAPPSMGFFRQECWSGLPFPSLGDFPDPGIEPSLRADASPWEPLPFESSLSDSCDLYPAAEFSLLLKLQRLPIPCRPELRLLRIAFTGPQHSLFTLFQTDFTVLPSTCPLLGFFFYASSPFSFLPQILAQFSH